MADTEAEDNHVGQLIKVVVWAYTRIRFKHYGQTTTTEAHGKKIRPRMTKLVLNMNQ